MQLAQAKEKTEKAEKAEKAEKPDKDEKAEKAEKPEKTEKSEGPEAPAQSGQVSTGTPPDTADGGSVAAAADDQALDQQQALDAVAVGDALPLANIVEAFTDAGLGEVIDADLVTFNGTLFYQLRIINPEGVVRTVFYDAKSGQAIEAN
ncbi:MAG: hypothetical protein JWR75_225 [Devosia sp.]|nr:hypothetical protein [Devosia sp.]